MGDKDGPSQEERLENLFGLVEDTLEAIQAENQNRERSAAVIAAAAGKASLMASSMEEAVDRAVERAIEKRMEIFADRATQKIDAAGERAALNIDQAEQRMQRVVGLMDEAAEKLQKKGWRSSLLTSGVLIGSVLLVTGITVWMINPALGKLRAEERSLRTEVGELEKLHDEWLERLKKDQLIPCWPSGKDKEKRLCYAVDTDFKPIKANKKTYMVLGRE